MRKKASGLVSVRAVSGTHVVFLALNMAEADVNGLLGFAIQRHDLTEQEVVWLRGNKTFASIRPATGIEDASSREHPFQAFQWADYSAKPGYKYRYRVIPMYIAHHRFRESVNRHIDNFGSAAFSTWKPQDLFEDWRRWAPAHFRAGSEHDIKRRYFADA